MFLYPLSITIILLSFAAPIFKGRQAVYAWTTAFALFAALGDAMATAPAFINQSGVAILRNASICFYRYGLDCAVHYRFPYRYGAYRINT